MAEQIITKTCPKCNKIRPVSKFNKDLARKDGRRFCCKICDSKQKKQYRQSRKGKATERLYRQGKKGKAAQKRYDQGEKGRARHVRYAKRYQIAHPEQIKAKTAVAHAIKKGVLPKADTLQCHYCPEQAKDYHHHKGYAPEFWLDVVPTCVKCHRKHPNSRKVLPTA